MDEQLLERAAKQAVTVVRQDNTIKELRAQLARQVPRGEPSGVDAVASPTALAESLRGELEDLQKRYDALKGDWEAERQEVIKLQALVEDGGKAAGESAERLAEERDVARDELSAIRKEKRKLAEWFRVDGGDGSDEG